MSITDTGHLVAVLELFSDPTWCEAIVCAIGLVCVVACFGSLGLLGALTK